MGQKVVVVTGGASGIGRSTCFRFAEENYRVVVADIQEDPRGNGVATHQRIAEGGGEAHFVETDVANWNAVQRVVQETLDRYEQIDVFINNAGFAERAPIDQLSITAAHRIFRVNIDGVFHGMKAVIPHMKQRGTGSIVNISSGAGKHGIPTLSAYSGSKFAVIGMTEAVAGEVEDDGITINAVCPGRTETAMTGFDGVPAERVADVIYETSQEEYTGRAVDIQ